MLEIMPPAGTTRVGEPFSVLFIIGGKRADGTPLAAVGDKYLLLSTEIQFKGSIKYVESVASDGTAKLVFVSEEGFTVPGTHVLRVEKSDDITLFAERTVTVEPALVVAEPVVPPEAAKAPLEWTVPKPAASESQTPDLEMDHANAADTRTPEEVFACVPLPPAVEPVRVKKTLHPLILVAIAFVLIGIIWLLYRPAPRVPTKAPSVPTASTPTAAPSKPAQDPKSPATQKPSDASVTAEPDASTEPNPYLRRAKRKR